MEKFKLFFKNHYKKLIIGVALAAGIGFIGSQFLSKGQSKYPEITKSETTLLAKKDFVNSISESGKAKSETTRNVYAEKALPVKEIKVEVGDTVRTGDVIAILEDSTIQQQLEQKQAQIAATNRNAGPQIKSARDRLNEAIRNRDQGTNSQVVSAQNAVVSAYDAWQSAEKTFENLNNSVATGYNEVINSQMANEKNLENTQITTDLTYQQSQNNLNRLQEDITKFGDLATRASNELDRLKADDSHIDRRIADVTKQLETAKGSVSNTEKIAHLEQQLRITESKLTSLEAEYVASLNKTDVTSIVENGIEKPKYEEEINQLNIKIANFRDEIAREKNTTTVSTTSPNASIDQFTRDLERLQSDSKLIKEKIAEVSGNKSKYEAELESARKSINSQVDQVNQNKLQFEITKDNRDMAALQKDTARKNLEDQLRMARKNADDAKNQYNAALKNLEISKIMSNDEINSLKNSLTIASAGGDNTLNYVDIKYLTEDLNKTVIKSPIDGTITNVNMIKGQAPTDYVAKIETIDRIIVESQVKEFDINRVRIGMKVEITGDALPMDTVALGEVESINPTAIPIAAGATSSEVAYKVIISLNEISPDIKPDMNVKVKYILEKQDDVFTAPSNAIYEKNGKFFMLIIEDKDVATVKEIEVTVVTKNDYESVIKSTELNEKIRVISSPDAYTTGMELRLVDTSTNPEKQGE